MLLTIENVFGGYGNGDVLKVSAAMPTMVMYFACLALMAAEKQLSSA